MTVPQRPGMETPLVEPSAAMQKNGFTEEPDL